MDIQARNEAIGFCKKYIDEHGGGGGETSSEIATIVNKLGAKNLLINVGADSATSKGVNFTKSADGTVSATRVSSADNTATYNVVDSAYLNTDHYANLGEVILSGTPADGSENMCVMLRQTSGTGHIYYNGVEVVDTDGTGALVDLEHCTLDAEGTTPIGRDDMRIIVRIYKTEEPNNVVFKPMLRYKGIEDGTYVPYVKTNKELTKDLSPFLRLTNPRPAVGFSLMTAHNDPRGYNWVSPEDGVFTEQDSVSGTELTVQYKLDVANPTPDTDYTVNRGVIFEPMYDMCYIMQDEYLKITVERPSSLADVNSAVGVSPLYYNTAMVSNGISPAPTGTFTIGIKLSRGIVFTGLYLSVSDRHTAVTANYSKTVYTKIKKVETVDETAYNGCTYKF